MSELIRVNIRITPEVHQWFKEKSDRTGVSMSSLMYLALEQHVQQQSVVPMLPDMLKQMELLKMVGSKGTDELELMK